MTKKKRPSLGRGSCRTTCRLDNRFIPAGLRKGDTFRRTVSGKSLTFVVRAGTTPQGRRYRFAQEVIAPERTTKKKTTKKRRTTKKKSTGRRATTKTRRKKKSKKRRGTGYRPLYG